MIETRYYKVGGTGRCNTPMNAHQRRWKCGKRAVIVGLKYVNGRRARNYEQTAEVLCAECAKTFKIAPTHGSDNRPLKATPDES